MQSNSKIAVVVPCYNEDQVLNETTSRLLELLSELMYSGRISTDSSIYFVNDGSRDRTWLLIQEWVEKDHRVVGINLSRNFGHQNALLAGLFTAKGDAIVTIDADLQDDIDVIGQMVDEFRRGTDIVYGVRRRRDTDTDFKRISASAFYALLSRLGVDSVKHHADFRLMSRRAIEALREFRETNLFLRGLVPLLGFQSSCIYYDRRERFAGQSKYALRHMLALAFDAVTAFSVAPLRIVSALGLCVSLGSMVAGLWVLVIRLFTERSVPGWASTALPVYMLGGVQILCLGVIGEYIGRVYSEIKSRPRYIIESVLASFEPTSGASHNANFSSSLNDEHVDQR